MQPGVGHYGVFNGRRFREEIYPRVRDFILKNTELPGRAEATCRNGLRDARLKLRSRGWRNFLSPASFADGDRLTWRGCAVRLKVLGRARQISLRVDRAKSEVVATGPHLATAVRGRRLRPREGRLDRRASWPTCRNRQGHRPRRDPAPVGPALLAGGRPSRPAEDDRGTPDRARTTAPGPEGSSAWPSAGPDPPDRAHRPSRRRPGPSHALGGHRRPQGSPGLVPFALPEHHGLHHATSWRLVLAPFEGADCVVAHVCAHLTGANHGPLFWAPLETRPATPRPPCAGCRAHAAELHAISA